ncbi:hypothetical protein HMPREF2538_10905, partial [Staphylococcus sp. HMSC063E12]|uniref:hypothetical protein n=2 Tax=unclassified Staphylococcus TaxID=91994 RepID=UPI00090F102A
KRLSKRKPTDNASWGGAPTKRLSKRKPTDNASWGEAPTVRNARRISTSKASWVVKTVLLASEPTKSVNKEGSGTTNS